MPSFLKDVSAFYGTGERNAAGQTLEEFLASYDPYKYKTPSCTTDAVVFSYRESRRDFSGLKLLLVRRSNHPSIGFWALPGGFVDLRENLEDAARRELEEETGVSGLPVEQFACYGDYDRDPRTRVITTAYMALVDEESVSVRAVREQKFTVKDRGMTAVDHAAIIVQAYLILEERMKRSRTDGDRL